jgi:hypothetical protein
MVCIAPPRVSRATVRCRHASWSPRAGFVVAVGIGLVLGVLSAWFDSLPIDAPLIVLVAMANAVGSWLFDRPVYARHITYLWGSTIRTWDGLLAAPA